MKKLISFTFLWVMGLVQIGHAQDAIAIVTHESSVDANNGTIVLDIRGGFAPYSFEWSGPNGYQNNSQNITNLSPGLYCVTVTDGLCGTLSVCETVIECDAILNVTTSSVCPYTTGNITISMGGPAPYIISWSDGAQQTVKLSAFTTRENLSPGQYCATVTNANGCSESMCRDLPPILPIQISGTVVNPVCPTLGNITLAITGGVTPFVYQWSDGNITTQNRTNLTVGTYCVTVSDANSCTATKCFTLSQEWAAGSFAEITGITHNPFNDNSCWYGSIDLTVQGNGGPFSYAWSNGNTTEDLQHLCNGAYTVTITNSLGCTKILTTTIKNCEQSTQPVAITNSSVSPVSNPGGADGSINLATSGGFFSGFDLKYKWTKQGDNSFIANTQDLFNLPGGTYCVVISGSCGQSVSECFIVVDCSLNAPAAPVITLNANGDNSYNNPPAPGSIETTVQGGTAPYTYQWSNGMSTKDITVTRGTYTVTVTDFCGKTSTKQATVAGCRSFRFSVQDNCGNDPELKFDWSYYMQWNSNEDINSILAYPGNTPTFCDKTIFVDWPDGSHSTLTLDLDNLVDPNQTQTVSLDYDPDGIFDIPSSLFGFPCATISDNCGCRNTFCDFVGNSQNAAGWEWQPIGDVAPQLVGVSFPVITRCFECEMCSAAGQIPDMNHMQLSDCYDDRDRTNLTYHNSDLENPCAGGVIHCPTLNTDYQVIPGAHGDPIVDWSAEPQYDPLTRMCTYPVGCLFYEGTVEGVDGPVYVVNPNGYQVENVNGLCEPPFTECDGVIITSPDPADINEECKAPRLCIPPDGGEPIVMGWVGVYDMCICEGKFIKVCQPLDESYSCDGEVLYSGPFPYWGIGELIYPQEYIDFVNDYCNETQHCSSYEDTFPQCSELQDPISSSRSLIGIKPDAILNEGIQEDDFFELYPNPTKNHFYLYSKHLDFTSIKMYDNLGHFVTELNCAGSKNGSLELKLPDGLSSGSYIIQANFLDGRTKHAKLVKID